MLIHCPECNKEISDKAVSCPNCGYPIAKRVDSDISERDLYNVILQPAFGYKINVTKGVKAAFNLSLYDAKAMVEKAPIILKRAVSLDEANILKSDLELYGATIIISKYDENEDEASLLRRYTDDRLHCPRCGSTAVTTDQRGFSLVTGFLGSNKTVNRCGKCGYSWKP